MARKQRKQAKKNRGKKPASRKFLAAAFDNRALRAQLVKLLDAGSAHLNFEKVVAGWPEAERGVKPPGAPHSAWQLLEHLRIGQWDILEFCRDAKHVSPPWPAGYWPATDAPPGKDAWDKSIRNYCADRESMQALVANHKSDLFRKIPHGTGQTLLHEALLVADHAAYHLGQLVLLRRLLGAWPAS